LDVLQNEAPNFIANRNEFLTQNSDSTPYYPTNINSKAAANQVLDAIKQSNKAFKKMNIPLSQAAQQQELSQDLEDLKVYFEKVLNDPDHFNPADVPFTARHQRAAAYLLTIDPTLSDKFPGL
jgi:hypothetical protein